MYLDELLDIEGVDKGFRPASTRSELDRISINTFRILLGENDPRWRLVYQIERLKNEGLLSGQQLEHALRADYLSDLPSIRRGNSRYIDEVTIPQLARALANIEIGHNIAPLFKKNFLKNSEFFYVEFEQARIGSGHIPDTRGVMGSHEALWQLLLFQKQADNLFVGRVGFNFHLENKTPIVSITNIQGV